MNPGGTSRDRRLGLSGSQEVKAEWVMESLITSGIDPALLRVLEKRGGERQSTPRRKHAAPEKTMDETLELEFNLNSPEHALDDLA